MSTPTPESSNNTLNIVESLNNLLMFSKPFDHGIKPPITLMTLLTVFLIILSMNFRVSGITYTLLLFIGAMSSYLSFRMFFKTFNSDLTLELGIIGESMKMRSYADLRCTHAVLLADEVTDPVLIEKASNLTQHSDLLLGILVTLVVSEHLISLLPKGSKD